jgi:hypothetical protein
VVYLHIGMMKTGTTYLQQLMIANRQELAEAGYLFPGETWARQVRASQDVLSHTRRDPKIAAEAAGAWQAICTEMLQHPGKASILSMEFLSFAKPRHARRAVAALPGAEVHVVLTVRDATATLPAQWQTDVHNGSTTSWPAYMHGARKATGNGLPLARFTPNSARRSFERGQGIAMMLDTWGSLVGPERLHVVTVPPPGSDARLLWQRFAGVVGVDPEVCVKPPSRANTSLGYASSELIRRVNEKLGRQLPTDYNPVVKEYLALKVLARRKEPRARLDRATREFGRRWNQKMRDAIVASGAEVVGDLDDLPTAPSAAAQPDEAPTTPSTPDVLAAAIDAVPAMQQHIRRQVRRLRKQGVEIDEAPAPDAEIGPSRWAGTSDPVDAAATEIADLARTAIDLRRRVDARPPGL